MSQEKLRTKDNGSISAIWAAGTSSREREGIGVCHLMASTQEQPSQELQDTVKVTESPQVQEGTLGSSHMSWPICKIIQATSQQCYFLVFAHHRSVH